MKKISLIIATVFALGLFLASASFASDQKSDSQDKYQKNQSQSQMQNSQKGQKMSAQKLQGKNLMLVDHLIGTNVMNQNNEQVGEIDKVLIDVEQGKVGYVIVSGGGVLGVGDEKYIVPFKALKKQQGQGEQILEGDRKLHQIAYTVSHDKLKPVPQGDIETALTQNEMNDIDEFYGVSPYWEDDESKMHNKEMNMQDDQYKKNQQMQDHKNKQKE